MIKCCCFNITVRGNQISTFLCSLDKMKIKIKKKKLRQMYVNVWYLCVQIVFMHCVYI